MVWAPEYKELVSSHGYPSNEVVIWRCILNRKTQLIIDLTLIKSEPRYPAMTRVAELMGHTERVLQTCLSPDTSTLVSAGADETLRYGLVVMVAAVVVVVVAVVVVVLVVVLVRMIGTNHWISSYQSLSVYSEETLGSVTTLVYL